MKYTNRTAGPRVAPRTSRQEAISAVLDSLGADLGNIMLEHKKRLGMSKKGPAHGSSDPAEGLENETPERAEEPDAPPARKRKGDVGLNKFSKSLTGR